MASSIRCTFTAAPSTSWRSTVKRCSRRHAMLPTRSTLALASVRRHLEGQTAWEMADPLPYRAPHDEQQRGDQRRRRFDDGDRSCVSIGSASGSVPMSSKAVTGQVHNHEPHDEYTDCGEHDLESEGKTADRHWVTGLRTPLLLLSLPVVS